MAKLELQYVQAVGKNSKSKPFKLFLDPEMDWSERWFVKPSHQKWVDGEMVEAEYVSTTTGKTVKQTHIDGFEGCVGTHEREFIDPILMDYVHKETGLVRIQIAEKGYHMNSDEYEAGITG